MILGYILCFLSGAWAISPIIVKQNKLFRSDTGEQFLVNGVAYQPRQDGKFYDPIVRVVRLLLCQRLLKPVITTQK